MRQKQLKCGTYIGLLHVPSGYFLMKCNGHSFPTTFVLPLYLYFCFPLSLVHTSRKSQRRGLGCYANI